MYTDFILDWETMGAAPEGAVVDLSVVAFKNDPYNPPNFEDLIASGKRVKFSLSMQKGQRVFDKSTIEWWKKQSEEAKKNIKSHPDDVSVKDGLETILEFLKSQGVDPWKSHGFCRGQSFDFPILVDVIRQVHGTRDTFNLEPVKFWNQRDIRTAIEYTLMKRDMTLTPLRKGLIDGFVHHDSIHDCAKDVMMLIYAQRYALGLEQAPGKEDTDPLTIKER